MEAASPQRAEFTSARERRLISTLGVRNGGGASSIYSDSTRSDRSLIHERNKHRKRRQP